MNARELFSHGEGVITRNDADTRESFGGALGNRTTSERMRQGFDFRVIFKRDVRRFVGSHQDENLCVGGDRVRVQNDEVGLGAAGCLALPGSEGCQIIAFSSHVSHSVHIS